MKSKKYGLFYLFSVIGILLASYYPLQMGIRVITDMVRDGTVLKENYPKYIIPYTPICFALILGVALMPLLVKLCKRFAQAVGSVLSLGVFFGSELLFENKVVVTAEETVVVLEDWQMFMCYVPADGIITTYKTQTPVDILLGNYHPAFKLHFYLIAAVIVLTVLHCFYGFGRTILNGDKSKVKALILQAAASALFVGMCIWACFTAFYRNGDLFVSPLSAVLMATFFILLGLTVGIFVGSFLLNKRKSVSCLLPAFGAAAVTLVMYVGEMILLSGHLYRFGTSFFFAGLPGIVLAPADVLVILASGVLTWLLCRWINGRKVNKG